MHYSELVTENKTKDEEKFYSGFTGAGRGPSIIRRGGRGGSARRVIRGGRGGVGVERGTGGAGDV